MFDFLLNFFVSPNYLWFVILLVGVSIILCTSSKMVCITRFTIALLLILALAQPYSPVNMFGGGSSGLSILEDNSSSYNVFGPRLGQVNYNLLKGQGNIDYVDFGEELVSNVGDSIIDSMREGKNVLLLSDGNINFGEEWGKVEEFAIIENLSVSTIRRGIEHQDYGVTIIGPDKIGPNTEATFTVQVTGTDGASRGVELEVDGRVVLTGQAGELEYVAKFGDGYHKLTARLLENDYFNENNVYYKSVKVVEKSKILLYGDEGTPLHRSLSKLYNIDVGTPYNLDRYHTVIVDDKEASAFSDRVRDLEDYVEDGNGLVVVGGRNSFDSGSYSGKSFEDLLPVKVSGVGKNKGSVSIMLMLDLTGGSEGSTAQISKNLAVDIVNSLDSNHNLGIVFFGKNIVNYWELRPLGEDARESAKNAIIGQGITRDYSANVESAFNFSDIKLDEFGGSARNFILLGDGQTGVLDASILYPYANSDGLGSPVISNEILDRVVKKGTRIFSVNVGGISGEDYEKLSDVSGGVYYELFFAESGIALEFGDPDGNSGSESKTKIFKANHFITEDLILDAEVLGTNQVLPKNSADLLITTSNGEPVLTVWRRGLGRVAVISTDNGNYWGGGLYMGTNSRVISRTVNWAAGDPERKKESFFSIQSPRVREETEIVIKGGDIPSGDVKFSRKSDGTYAATIIPEEAGFFNFEEDEYSVNYNSEFNDLGMNENLINLVESSGGHVFEDSENILDVLNYLKEKKNITTVEKELFIWPLLSLAMIIFVLDVWFRTVSERKNI